MQEQLVSFETAKLAKEKGFDIPQNKMFSVTTDYSIFNKTDNPEIVKFYNGDKHQCSNIPHNWNNETIMSTKYYSAPTQSLLQKWLREVHKIHIIVYCMEKSLENGWETYFDVHLKQETKMNALQSIAGKAREFNTYEQALEIGLQEALKLIPDETKTN